MCKSKSKENIRYPEKLGVCREYPTRACRATAYRTGQAKQETCKILKITESRNRQVCLVYQVQSEGATLIFSPPLHGPYEAMKVGC